MMLSECVELIQAEVGNPADGLPDAVFRMVTSLTAMVNVDLLVRNARGEALLTWRSDELYHGWHVPGGIVRFKERLADRIAAVARTELSAGVRATRGPIAINEIIHPARRLRGHFISFLYECELIGEPAPALRHSSGPPEPGQWAWHAQCPPDIIQAHEMYRPFIDPRS